MNEQVRAYIYRVITAASPILAFHGIVTQEEIGLYLALVSAVLGNIMAVANTSTKAVVVEEVEEV
jgi:formate hydrogenlyase subunit 3/multisubunit Na+/H+ antiporter MnhD subunit